MLENVYRDNYELKFSTGSKVTFMQDIDDGSCVDVRVANVINVWAWAGNSTANCMIFPQANAGITLNGTAAYDIFPTWDSSITMQDTVFAIVEIDRLNEDIDPTANIEIDEVGEFRFGLKTIGFYDNPFGEPIDEKYLRLPSWALVDYLTNDVYGCGLSNADIDFDSINAWDDYCAETAYYASYYSPPLGEGSVVGSGTYNGDVVYRVSTQDKRRCDAFVNTQEPVIQTINKICQAGDATFSYDSKQGKFKVLVNKAMTSTEKTNAFEFNADNIVGAVTVNSTDLYSLFNFSEVSFPNTLQQDQVDNVLVEIPTADRVTNEPNSGTSYALDYVTRRYTAAEMANVSLKQTRVDNTYSFTGDHTTIEVDIGDYVKITDPTKYLENDYARVMRIVEREQQDGTLVFDFVCVQYSDTPYTGNYYLDDVDLPFGESVGLTEMLGVGGNTFVLEDFYTTYEIPFGQAYLANVEVGGVVLVNENSSGLANIYYSNATLAEPNANADVYQSASTISSELPDRANEPWIAIKGYIGALEFGSIADGFTRQRVTMTNQAPADTRAPEQIICEYDTNTLESQNWGWFPLEKLPVGNYTVSLQYENPATYPVRRSQIATTGVISITDLNCDTPNVITLDDTYYGRGNRLVDEFSLAPAGDQQTAARIHPRQFDVCNISQANFEVSTNLYVNWSTLDAGISKIMVAPTANITFESSTSIDKKTFTVPLAGIDLVDNAAGGNIDAANIKANWVNNSSTISTIPSDYGLDADDWYPARLSTDLIAQYRSFTGLSIDGGFLFTHIPHNYRYLV